MTTPTKNALLALTEAIQSECERGHIPDERGDLTSACRQLQEALKTEPVEPLAYWPCSPSHTIVPVKPSAPVELPPIIEPTIGDDPAGGSYKVTC